MRARMDLVPVITILAISVWSCGSDDTGGGSAGGVGGKDGGAGTGALGGSSGAGGVGGSSGSGGTGGSAGVSGGGSGGAGTFKRVFVTSDELAPDLGGALQGDAACQTVADSVSLGGTWMAWLSDDTTSPTQRFAQSTMPYVLLDGTTIATSFADLISGQLAAPLNRDENNGAANAVYAWTGTRPDGTAASDNCQGWTVAIGSTATRGSTDATDEDWTSIGVAGCILKQRLYCFEQ